MAKIFNLAGIAELLGRVRNTAYSTPNTIAGVNPGNWPTANQPIAPANPGAGSLMWPFLYGQNQIYTPRPDSTYTAADLRNLSMFPLSRICIDNTKDVLCTIPWSIQLRKMPGESDADIKARRKAETKGDKNIAKLSNMFEWPDGDHDWSEWLRRTLEDMLVIDGACTLIQRNRQGKVIGFEWTSGDPITVYIDDSGRRPKPPSPAYAQLWQGYPRTDLTSDQLIYKPRNIVPRVGISSSYLYGCSPVETLADEIKVGMSRLAYVMAYYDQGSMSNMIHVVPPGVPPDKLKEAMQFINSELAGNFTNRRQYRIIQGFQEEGKPDQLVFPEEPVLADVFDDLLIRKICFGFGTSPQRLMKQMNRASASTSQTAAQEEGIRPWMDWVKRYANYIIQRVMAMPDYELDFDPYFESDYLKKAKGDVEYMKEGALTRNEVREDLGRDPSENPLASQLCCTTANGIVALGTVITSGKGGDGDGSPKPTPPSSKQKLIQRGEV